MVLLKKKKVWLEVTNLLIPGKNDSKKEIKERASWVLENLGEDTPIHFSAFYPCHKMMNIAPTKPESVISARKIAMKLGLKYVYAGNVFDEESNSTFCPNCGEIVIRRSGYLVENKLVNGKCCCGESIAGVWS